jgi:NADH/F420H2 dehydrogenase subunit C
MDLVPRSTNIPSGTTGYRDQNAALARDLAPIAQITSKPLAATTQKGDYLGLEIDRENLVAVCRFLRDQLGFDLLSCISGVDMLDHLETIYHLRSVTRNQLLQLKVRLDNEKPEVESVVSVWPTANWLERETYDMYGIHFAGHPDLRRMLFDDDFE